MRYLFGCIMLALLSRHTIIIFKRLYTQLFKIECNMTDVLCVFTVKPDIKLLKLRITRIYISSHWLKLNTQIPFQAFFELYTSSGLSLSVKIILLIRSEVMLSVRHGHTS